MTSSLPGSTGPAHSAPAVRRAHRSSEDSYLGGVCGGLAEHLGVDPLWVRVFFLATSTVGFGVLLYAALWVALPMRPRALEEAPGLEAATRQGRRTGRAGSTSGLHDPGPLVAVGVLVLGLVTLTNAAVGGPVLLWPVLLAAGGVVVLWRQADEAQRERWRDGGRLDARRILLGDGGLAAVARVATGAGLLVVALILFAAQTGQLSVARDVVVAGLLGVLGLALTLGPWLVRLVSDLSAERAARIRSQERADVAAHLHDSVLQTLALIQKNAADPAQVSRLARSQERDLRSWMYGDDASGEGSLMARLRASAAEVEDTFGVPVEVVTVGDADSTEALRPLVQAAREAMVNAAKHSAAAKVDVYAEVGGTQAEVFVRDRGVGFDAETVPEDRLGLRGSIVDRMERHGGTARVRSGPGEGTEIRLGMPLPAGGAHVTEEQG